MTKNKNHSIETMRGLACLMLVAYHVVGSNGSNGLQVPDNGIVRHICDVLSYLRMPLFAFISGYVYGLCKINKDSYVSFYQKKLRKLGVPLLTVSTAFWVVSSIVGNEYGVSMDNLHRIYLHSYAHFWFLQASILIFLFICACDYVGILKSKISYAAVFFTALMLSITYGDSEHTIMSFNGATYLLPFFMVGLAVKRFSIELAEDWRLVLAAVLAVVYAKLMDAWYLPDKTSISAIAVSIFSCFALYQFRLKSAFLEYVGKYSYAIYLYHIFFTSGVRMALERAGVDSAGAIFFASLLLGITAPMFIARIAGMNNYLAFIALGDSIKKRPISGA